MKKEVSLPQPVYHNHVGFEVTSAIVVKNCVFWDTLACSTLKYIRCFSEPLTNLIFGACCLPLWVPGFAYFSTVKMKTCSSETSTEFQWDAQR
jgi:hypothetical protein